MVSLALDQEAFSGESRSLQKQQTSKHKKTRQHSATQYRSEPLANRAGRGPHCYLRPVAASLLPSRPRPQLVHHPNTTGARTSQGAPPVSCTFMRRCLAGRASGFLNHSPEGGSARHRLPRSTSLQGVGGRVTGCAPARLPAMKPSAEAQPGPSPGRGHGPHRSPPKCRDIALG